MSSPAIDLPYICTVLGNLTGIPVRLYRKHECIFYHSVIKLPKDPVCVYLDEIFSVEKHVGYFFTRHFYYYGIVTSGDLRLVLGPTRKAAPDEHELREFAFRADVPQEDVPAFVEGMKNIICLPLESDLQTLLAINHLLNGEKLSLAEVTVYDVEKQDRLPSVPPSAQEEPFGDINNNSLATEQTLLTFVRHGDKKGLLEWASSAPAVNSGTLANEQTRQQKNTFIVTTTVVCRAAIRGGMNLHDALSLSDAYIQKCESLSSYTDIFQLMYQMVLDYTERVERLRQYASPSRLVLYVRNYILHHLSDPIRTSEIADALFLSRSNLSTRFKEESGENLSDFILKEKIKEAKRLLRYTDKPIVAISSYLGFSSQSHFTHTFKKFSELSPAEYRKRNQ